MKKSSKTCNVEAVTGAYLLQEEEGAVLLRMMSDLLEELGDPTKGNLVLWGQRWQSCAMHVTTYRMRDGEGQRRYCDQVLSTQEVSGKAINWAFVFPDGYYSAEPDELYTDWPESGIFTNDIFKVLILNCDQGRFLASCCVDFPDGQSYATTKVLLTVAMTLSNLRPHDHKLRKSCEQLWANLDTETLSVVADISNWATQHFYAHSPETENWNAWRRKFDRTAELPSYFGKYRMIPVAL